ncbi:DUF89 family protein [bacterium]|nr:DUF89 family protein [bacterium]
MRTFLDCIPCFVRQALEAARFAGSEVSAHEYLLRETLGLAARMDLSQSPPAMGQIIHRRLRELTGVADPYRAVKQRFNRLVQSLLPDLRRGIRGSPDPLGAAVRLAIAGNVIDLGVCANLSDVELYVAIEQGRREPLLGNLEEFPQAVAAAERILYLADNAGEIFLDRLLIEQLPTGRVTLAVRGGPILNDATREDAEAAGLAAMVEIIDNGSDAPGTILSDCNETFRERFAAADLIVAKGQGNFETLSDVPAPLWFLFKAKCPIIADYAGQKLGAHVVMRSQAPPCTRALAASLLAADESRAIESDS